MIQRVGLGRGARRWSLDQTKKWFDDLTTFLKSIVWRSLIQLKYIFYLMCTSSLALELGDTESETRSVNSGKPDHTP